jgi:hypothetical protein
LSLRSVSTGKIKNKDLTPRTPSAVITLALCTSFAPAYAGNYDVSVTRKGSNVYKGTGSNTIIVTRYCYEYAYSEDAILKSSGYSGKLIFVNNGTSCDVKSVYGKANVAAGNYTVTVSRDNDDWYEIVGQDMFIQTSMCLSLSLGEEATLKLNSNGFGKLIFDSGTSCMVEGIFSRVNL